MCVLPKHGMLLFLKDTPVGRLCLSSAAEHGSLFTYLQPKHVHPLSSVPCRTETEIKKLTLTLFFFRDFMRSGVLLHLHLHLVI